MSMLAIEKFMILRSVAMFSDMPGDALLDLVQLLREEEVDAGRVVIREDDYGSRLYIAVSGRYRVSCAAHRWQNRENARYSASWRYSSRTALGDGRGDRGRSSVHARPRRFPGSFGRQHPACESVIRMLCRRLRDTGARISVSANSARPASGLAS